MQPNTKPLEGNFLNTVIEQESIAKEPIRRIKINESEITILGTAHISSKSVDAVREIIEKEKPDTVCVELCNSRMTSIQDPEHWKKLDIF